MKTQYYTASSLDGFIATEDHSPDWLFQFGDTGSSGFTDFIEGIGAGDRGPVQRIFSVAEGVPFF